MTTPALGPITRLRLTADLVLLIVFVGAAIEATGFAVLARYMPFFATSVGAILAAALFVRDLVKARRLGGDAVIASEAMDTAVLVDDDMTPAQALKRAGLQLCWFLAYAVVIALVGVIPGSALFVAVFLWTEGRMQWPFVLISSGATVALLLLIGNVMNLRWPETLWGA